MIEFLLLDGNDGPGRLISPCDTDLKSLATSTVGLRVIANGSCIYEDPAFGWDPIQEEEVIEALKSVEIVSGEVRLDAGTFFVAGGCSLLANAMVRLMPHLHVVAVYDAVDEDGEDLEQPYLIHAGLALADGSVLDVDGAIGMDEWFERWSSLGLDCTLESWGPGVEPFADSGAEAVGVYAAALMLACAPSFGLLAGEPHTGSVAQASDASSHRQM